MQQANIANSLAKAQTDRAGAKILLDHGGSEAGIGFKCQQAVEKFLKAALDATRVWDG